MPYPSPTLFDLALNFLYRQRTKIHYRYIVNNINDGSARLIIGTLIEKQLIKKVDGSDYFKITDLGREVVENGGYQMYMDGFENAGNIDQAAMQRMIRQQDWNETRRRVTEASYRAANPEVTRPNFIKALKHWFVQHYLWGIFIATLGAILPFVIAPYFSGTVSDKDKNASPNITEVKTKNSATGNISGGNVVIGDHNIGQNTTIINKTSAPSPVLKPFVGIVGVETVKQADKLSVFLTLNAYRYDVFDLRAKIFMVTRTLGDSLIYDGAFNSLSIKRILLTESITLSRSANITYEDSDFKNFYFYLKGEYKNDSGKSFPLNEFGVYSFERKEMIVPSEKEEALVRALFKKHGID